VMLMNDDGIIELLSNPVIIHQQQLLFVYCLYYLVGHLECLFIGL